MANRKRIGKYVIDARQAAIYEHDVNSASFTSLSLSSTLEVDGATTLNGNVAVGNATSDTIGFYGVTKVAQLGHADQTALTDSTGGSVSNATLAAVGDTSSDQSAAINANFAKTAQLVNRLRADLVSLGLIKGSA
tara:strand:+ start:349 stop:753 length:405 start_codon:yes stop_codon:yes gene_type:complete